MYIVKESVAMNFFVYEQSFFAHPVVVDDKIAQAMTEIQMEAVLLSNYLTELRVNPTLEVPAWLDAKVTPVVVSASPPKKKGTARTSKKKSPKGSKKTAAKQTTSPPADA